LTLGLARAVIAATTGSGDQVVATVGSMKITQAEVDEKARPQLSAIQNQVYTVKKRVLDDMIDDYLIDQAAKKAGLSKDAYLKKEVEEKATAPPAGVHFYNKNQARIRQPFDKIKARWSKHTRRQSSMQAPC
jgi:hypothetical protein